jgi:hypothetical protein
MGLACKISSLRSVDFFGFLHNLKSVIHIFVSLIDSDYEQRLYPS